MAGYGRYLTIRLINSLIVIFFVSLFTLALFGPFVDQQLKQEIRQSVRQQILSAGGKFGGYQNKTELEKVINQRIEQRIKALGLDKPWYIRIWGDLYRLFTFNFGMAWVLRSDSGSQYVADIIIERIPRTVILFALATLLNYVFGIYLGIKAASKPNSLFDRTTVMGGLLGWSFATWWVGMVMIYVFAYIFPIFPLGGMTSVPPPHDPFKYTLDVLWHLTLPTITMVLVAVGGMAYSYRNLAIGVLTEDYIVTARAKGLPERDVLYKYALKMILPPILTGATLAIAGIFSGGLLTEIVFNWPGMGLLYWEAINALDIPVLIGDVYITTILLVLANITADLLYGVVDPRVRLGARVSQ